MSVLGNLAASVSKGANMGTFGKIAQVVGAVAEAGGTIYEGVSAEKQSRAAAKGVMRRAVYEAQLRRRQGRRVAAEGMAMLGTMGVEPSGSPLMVIDQNIREAELDAQMILAGGRAESSQLKAAGRGEFLNSLITGSTSWLTSTGDLLKNAGKKKIPGSKIPQSDFLDKMYAVPRW